jgi:hypothetical protein
MRCYGLPNTCPTISNLRKHERLLTDYDASTNGYTHSATRITLRAALLLDYGWHL